MAESTTPTKNIMEHSRQHWEACMEIQGWYYFVASSVVSLVGGIIVILVYRTLLQIFHRLKAASTCCAPSLNRNSSLGHSPTGADTLNGSDYQSALRSNHPFRRQRQNRSSHTQALSRSSSFLNAFSSANGLNRAGSLLSKSVSMLTIGNNDSKTCLSRLIGVYHACGHFIHQCALRLVSYQWWAGRVCITVSMILSLCSFGIYAFEATRWPGEVEKCGHKGRRFRTLDFAMNIFFLFHFLVRLIAARDALVFWVDWFSILDYLTVPPTLLGFVIKRTWLGFRFVRAFRLVNLSEVLHNLNMIKTVSSLRLCHFCTVLLSIWLAGAGMLLLLENTGDFNDGKWYDVPNPINYPTALYFTIVTMSTVGYGDVTPQTLLGRLFVSLFILVALATFASAIPVIVEIFFTVRKYSGSYSKQEGKTHIVVCGDITTDSVKSFLSDFLHEDRERSDVEVVFVNPSMPDLQLQSLLRLHFSRVKYFQGTVMDHNDLQRVRMSEADACLILASSAAGDADEKDAANVMRVIAVKNYACHVRVIVQLLQTQNKAHLFNSPYWNWDGGDEIICFSELKLGFLAQSCIAPGFSTLLTNLFSMRSQSGLRKANKILGNTTKHSIDMTDENVEILQETEVLRTQSVNDKHRSVAGSAFAVEESRFLSMCPLFLRNLFRARRRSSDSREATKPLIHVTPSSIPDTRATTIRGTQVKSIDTNWLSNYLHGVSMELYSALLSAAFEGLNFVEAAVLCREKLDLLLIAVVARVPGLVRSSTDDQVQCVISVVEEEEESKGQDSMETTGTEDRGRTNGDEDRTDEESDQEEIKEYLAINPSTDRNVIMSKKTVAFFICDSQMHASRASVYCNRCHGDQINIIATKLKECACHLRRSRRRTGCSKFCLSNCFRRNTEQTQKPLELEQIKQDEIDCVESQPETKDPLQPIFKYPSDEELGSRGDCNKVEPERRKSDPTGDRPSYSNRSSRLDLTGMYHYCDARTFEDSLLSENLRQSPIGWRQRKLINHILLCLITDETKPPLGLDSFVMPLRASYFQATELKPIVLLGNEAFLRSEWTRLTNFPDVYCLPGSPLSRGDLRAARIRFSSMCVVLGAVDGNLRSDDPYMLDKEAILCSLNIRGMRFPPVTSQSLLARRVPNRRSGSEVPLITALMTDANIHYLDPEDVETGTTQIPASLTVPFARGIAFTTSVLDVLASTAYFDRNSMTLIRHLITGGVTPALEQWLAEGGGLNGIDRSDDDELEHDSSSRVQSPNHGPQYYGVFMDQAETRRRPRVAQLPITDARLRPVDDDNHKGFKTFGELFCHAIQENGILCIGIYRNYYITDTGMKQPTIPRPKQQNLTPVHKGLSDQPSVPNTGRRLSTCAQPVDKMLRKYSVQLQREKSIAMSADPNSPTYCGRIPSGSNQVTVINRYVLTNPPNRFRLQPTDLIFCLCPFDPNLG